MATGFYDITSKTLGKGHYGLVKLARHCLTGEPVAIKIIEKARLNRESLCQLGTEIRILFRLSEYEHPNILKLYQVIDTETKLHLITEYCGPHACDLHDYLFNKHKRSGLPEKEAQHVFKQICSAIAYCHSLKIVHRDLKPENILVTDQKHTININVSGPLIKLIDFGFANQWSPDEKMRTSCGTLAYSAPELLLGEIYDGTKVDIWGLGIMLYILLFGGNPFMQINDNETLTRILDCSFTIPQRTDISEYAIQLVKSLIRRDPNSRLLVYQILQHPWLESTSSKDLHSSSNAVHHPHLQNHHSLHPSVNQSPSTSLKLSSSLSAITATNINSNQHTKAGIAAAKQQLLAAGLPAINEVCSSDKNDEDEFTSLPINTRSRSLSGGDKQTFCGSSSPMSNGSCSSLGRSHPTPRSSSTYYRPTSPDISGGEMSEEDRNIHERIINEILSLGCLCESKASIEQSLKNARLTNRRFNNTSILKDVSGKKTMSKRDNSGFEASSTKNNSQHRSNSFRIPNDEYINATYQLLRDRALRNTHNIKQPCDPLSTETFRTKQVDSNQKTLLSATVAKEKSFKSMVGEEIDDMIMAPSTDVTLTTGEKNHNNSINFLATSKTKQQQQLMRRRLLQPQHKLKDKFTSFFRSTPLSSTSETCSNENELNEQSLQVNNESKDCFDEIVDINQHEAFTDHDTLASSSCSNKMESDLMSYALPLARKCSLVSEEGSCAGDAND